MFVSELRKALEPERGEGDPPQVIRSVQPGYRIEIGHGQLDLVRFERLTEDASRMLGEGDPASASAKLAEALELWRGPALDDFTYE